MQTIPKRFHAVWVGGNPLPGQFRDYQTEWMRLHPGWSLTIWDDAAVRGWIAASDQGLAFPFRNRRIYETLTIGAQKCDLLCVEILYAHGGVYIDCDFEPAKNIEPLLDGVSAFAATEGFGIISGGIMGAVQGHPVFRSLIDGIPASIQNAPPGTWINGITGPNYRTPIFQRFPDVKVFDRELFYPFYMGEKHLAADWKIRFPTAYAAHHWAGSWLSTPEGS